MVRGTTRSTRSAGIFPASPRDVFLEGDISTGYFLTLMMANLITLSGLLA